MRWLSASAARYPDSISFIFLLPSLSATVLYYAFHIVIFRFLDSFRVEFWNSEASCFENLISLSEFRDITAAFWSNSYVLALDLLGIYSIPLGFHYHRKISSSSIWRGVNFSLNSGSFILSKRRGCAKSGFRRICFS